MYQENFFYKLKKTIKTNLFQISLLILSILIAFIYGNIFGISSKRIPDPLVFTICFILVLELISFFKFSKNIQIMENYISKQNLLSTDLNAAKRGFLIGIFIEAFKVGS